MVKQCDTVLEGSCKLPLSGDDKHSKVNCSRVDNEGDHGDRPLADCDTSDAVITTFKSKPDAPVECTEALTPFPLSSATCSGGECLPGDVVVTLSPHVPSSVTFPERPNNPGHSLSLNLVSEFQRSQNLPGHCQSMSSQCSIAMEHEGNMDAEHSDALYNCLEDSAWIAINRSQALDKRKLSVTVNKYPGDSPRKKARYAWQIKGCSTASGIVHAEEETSLPEKSLSEEMDCVSHDKTFISSTSTCTPCRSGSPSTDSEGVSSNKNKNIECKKLCHFEKLNTAIEAEPFHMDSDNGIQERQQSDYSAVGHGSGTGKVFQDVVENRVQHSLLPVSEDCQASHVIQEVHAINVDKKQNLDVPLQYHGGRPETGKSTSSKHVNVGSNEHGDDLLDSTQKGQLSDINLIGDGFDEQGLKITDGTQLCTCGQTVKQITEDPLAKSVVQALTRQGPESQQSDNRSRSQSWAGGLSYMQKWQNQHVAKSIVDNAINKTLEELGLSPNPSVNETASQRHQVESEGISEAIRARGLRRNVDQSNNLDQTRDRLRRLDPIISRLTQVSENIFARNMFLPPRHHSLAQHLQQDIASRQGGEETNDCLEGQLDVQSGPGTSNEIMSLKDTAESREVSVDMDISCSSSEEEEGEELITNNVRNDSVLEGLGMHVSPSTSDLLDQAVNAAIHEKGLKLE